MRKNRYRISSYEELISGFGKNIPKPASPLTHTGGKIFTKSFNAGEPLISKEEYDSYPEYVLQSSITDLDFEEYVVQKDSVEHGLEAGMSELFSIDNIAVEHEYKVDVFDPLSHVELNTQQAIPTTETNHFDDYSFEKADTITADNQIIKEEIPIKPQPNDDDLNADLEAILRGEKVFDPVSKKTVEKKQAGQTPPYNPPPSYQPPVTDTNNEHAIFDRIAQSMQYANAYDLGSVDLENRFSDFDRIADIERNLENKVKENKPRESIKGELPLQNDISTAQFIEDLDAINKSSRNDSHEEHKDYSEATTRKWIIENADLTPQSRSFNPAANTKTGVTNFSVRIASMPASGTVRWSVPPKNKGTIQLAGKSNVQNGLNVSVSGIRPGLTALDVDVRDAAGKSLESIKFPLCVPQFVTITEEAAAFDATLTAMNAQHLKVKVIEEAKTTCDFLLSTVNARTIWTIGGFTEKVPAHIPANMITTLTVRGNPPAGRAGLAGITRNVGGTGGWDVGNEAIDLFPGSYISLAPSADPRESTLAIASLMDEIIRIQASSITHESLMIKIIGRLIGETMAHEIIHSLTWKEIDPSFHSALNDIMDDGSSRNLTQRTGIINNNIQSPIDIGLFVDNGIHAINQLHPTNQAILNTRFPVPPAFL